MIIMQNVKHTIVNIITTLYILSLSISIYTVHHWKEGRSFIKSYARHWAGEEAIPGW